MKKINEFEEIGKTLKEFRKKGKITQHDLAMYSGVSVSFVIDLEKGKPTCELAKVFRVLKKVGIRIYFEGIGL